MQNVIIGYRFVDQRCDLWVIKTRQPIKFCFACAAAALPLFR
jgi:hypothetical protein